MDRIDYIIIDAIIELLEVHKEKIETNNLDYFTLIEGLHKPILRAYLKQAKDWTEYKELVLKGQFSALIDAVYIP